MERHVRHAEAGPKPHRTTAIPALATAVLAFALCAGGTGVWVARLAAAALQTGPDTVEVDALQCWRRVDKNAVHVGERLDMTLTCSVVETETVRTVPDLAWLEPATLTVSPFEVLDGERYGDIVRGPRRFFQYRYALRIIGEDYFGIDVELPALEVKYRIARALDGNAAVEGRELTYVLPPESVRVLALVPAAVNDIRELPGETFGNAEARLFRANATGIAAAVLGIIAFGTLMLAGVRARREWRGSAGAVDERLSDWRVARSALRELTAVQASSRTDGWTTGLVGRALATYRVAGALALESPVAQRRVVNGVRAGDDEGQLHVPRWLLGSTEALVSSAVTAARIDREVERVRTERPKDVGAVESIRDGLALFSAARYRSAADLETDAMTAQVDAGVDLLGRLQTRMAPPVRFVERLGRSVREWIAQVWSR